MKNLLLVFVGFLFTANLFAQIAPQKADTVFSYEWKSEVWEFTGRSFNTYSEGCQPGSLTTQAFVNGLWINADKTLYTYDANGRVSVETYQSWDTISSSFKNSYRDTYTYNASGNITLGFRETWDGSAWQNGSRATYTYNASGNITIMLSETWNGSTWENASRDTYTYDGNGYLISLLGETWFGGSWVNSGLGTYTNNGDGTPYRVLAQGWNRGTYAWENLFRETYTYNAAGKMLTQLEEDWWQGAWVNSVRRTYTYSGNNLTNELTEYDNGNGGWVNDHQYTNTYNSDGTVSQRIGQGWNGIIWVNSWREDYVYIRGCALPLTLLNFTGTKNSNSVLLTWKTANEINTSHFTVQRSLDAIDFSDIKTVPATPGSVTKTYSFTDNIAGIKAPKIYYRLQMVDKDGKSEMSRVVPVTLANQGLQFIIKPNPAKDYFVITHNASTPSDALVNITDFSGRSVFKQTIILSGEQKINISALPKGVYLVTINTGDNITTQKLVIE